jgi:hypothetical protein
VRPWLYPLGVALLAVGGALLGYGLFSGDDAAEPAPAAYSQAACEACPVNVTSAEVQDRDGSTLFVFRGDWPAKPADVPADLTLTANDVVLVLHPVEDGFELVKGTRGGEPLPDHTVAAAIEDGALLVNLEDSILEAPVRFALAGLIPDEGGLLWNGTGVPTQFANGGGETTTGTDTTGGFRAETAEEFMTMFTAAFRQGDDAFLLERLNPAVIELYGEDQCAAFVGTLKDPTRAYTVKNSSELKPYDYNPDGQSVTIPGAYTVTVQARVDGKVAEQEIHLAPVEDTLTWFADCGDL